MFNFYKYQINFSFLYFFKGPGEICCDLLQSAISKALIICSFKKYSQWEY